MFETIDELRSPDSWHKGTKHGRYRWPTTLPWTRGCYALLVPRIGGKFRSVVVNDVLLVAPQLPIRSGDRCAFFIADYFQTDVFCRKDGTKLEFDLSTAEQGIQRVHRLLGALDADPN